MNNLLSAIKAFVLKSRPAYKDYLGNGKYDIKKLPEECVPDSLNDNIKNAKSKADSAYDEASSAYSTADLAYGKAMDVDSRLFALTNLNYNFQTLEYTHAKNATIGSWVIRTDGISDIPLAESKAPMACYFDIVLKDSNNNQIGKYSAFDRKIVRGITNISETYRLFIDERAEIGSDGYAELKIGYKLKNDDNLWHKTIEVYVRLPSTDIDNANISSVFLHAWSGIVDVDNYAPWPSICVPLASTNDAGVVYASDKTDDQTVPVSIDKNGYLWCKGSETTTPDYNQNNPTASDYIKNRPCYRTPARLTIANEIECQFEQFGGLYIFNSNFSFIEGNTYFVFWDGIEYECVCKSISGNNYIGNIGIYEGEAGDNQVPFLITEFKIATLDTSPSHTVGIDMNGYIYNKLDAEYIENGLVLKRIIYHDKPEITREEFEKYNRIKPIMLCWRGKWFDDVSSDGGTPPKMICSHAGERIIISINADNVYLMKNYKECSVSIASVIGDRIGTAGLDLDENMATVRPRLFSSGNSSTDTIFKVKKNGSKSGIDFEVLGDGSIKTNYVIIGSSTPNSTKKFKITVDDTGTISATEVTT